MLTEDEVIERFTALRQHQKNGKRSPHKPFPWISVVLSGKAT